jgi:LuxR family maltose regulon positive regulatory protein
MTAAAHDASASQVPLDRKLVAPPRRNSRLDRAHLLERLDALTGLPLTLVCAPAGFGKTTLLVDWLARARVPAAWLAVDSGDNDPTRFWTYFVAALQRLEPRVGVSARGALQLQARDGAPLELDLTGLAQDLAALEQPLALVIDDYHLVDAPTVHRGLAFLLEQPGQLHLILGTRADPLLPLARLRARGQLGELRATDLRLTTNEAATFLNDVMGIDVSAAQVAQLEARTEGWLAGLQLAALSMRGRSDLDAFVAAFTGSHRFVIDYLLEDVLEREPEQVQTFLQETSILDRVTADLCDAITARGDGQAMLELAERQNLFVVALDDERRWYRYHHLFADALRQRLRRQSRNSVVELHRRASTWFADHGLVDEAVEHALTAQDWERAAQLINSTATALVDRGEQATLDRWLATAPDALYRAQPLLAVRAAEARAWLGDLSSADVLLDRVEQQGTSAANSVLGYAAALRTRIAVLRNDGASAIAYGQRAVELLPAEDASARASALVELGSARLLVGQLDEADKLLREALTLARQANARAEEWTTLLRLARLERRRGRLRSAATYLQMVLDATTELRVMSRTGAEYRLGALKLEWNQLDEAEAHVERAIGLDDRTTGRRLLGLWLWRVRGDLSSARGDFAGALAALDHAAREAERVRNIPELRRIRAAVANIWIRTGDLAAARDWATRVAAETDAAGPASGSGRDDELLVRARLHLMEGAPARAIELLRAPLATAESAGLVGDTLRFLVVLAVAYEQSDNRARAVSVLERALDLAEPGGYVRTFLDEGPSMIGLLRAERPMRAYVASLLGTYAEDQPAAAVMHDAPSQRELEVLRLIADGLDNAQIAERLVISVNTVKSHVHHLMNKLDATNRMQLAARGRQLHLLP